MSDGTPLPGPSAPGHSLSFLQPRSGVRIAVRCYRPPGVGGEIPVILAHGLLASAEIFDVPGLPHLSLARFLQAEGHPVYAFDQRGSGDSTTTDWRFGMREAALVDLPAVIGFVLEREGVGRTALVAHSLGGLILYVLLAALARGRGAVAPELDPSSVAGVACIASPARFSRELEPWRTLAARGPDFIQEIDADGNGVVDKLEFVRASIVLSRPSARFFLGPTMLRPALAAGSRSRRLAGLLKAVPVRSLLYHPSDFDPAAFQHVLASRTLDRAPATLISEIFETGISGRPLRVSGTGGTVTIPDDLARISSIPFVSVTSALDALVPAADVAYAHDYLGGEQIVTERDLGGPSGHAGYFFKEGVRARLYQRLLAFLAAIG